MIVMVAILATFAVIVVAAIVAHIRKPEPKISRIGPNAGVWPKCGSKLLRGPLNGADSLILIDPAPQAWLDDSLRLMFGYVWACGKCKWTDHREEQGPALLWGSKSLGITDNEREAHL